MKITQIVNETSAGATGSGSVATVSSPLGSTQSRNASIYNDKKVGSLFKGKKTNKPFANSISEGKKVDEAKLDEDDIIIVPGQKMKRKTGFVQHGQSRVDHEVEMARSDVLATMKNAKAIYQLLKSRTEDEGLEGWVQEKLIKANDYLNAVKEYYDEKMMQEMTGGVIAGGMAGEGVAEGQLDEKFKSKQQAKLMYAAAGDKDVAKKTGVSQKVAKEFVKKSHGQKVSKLPTKVSKKD
jgi:hypothetical protein